MSRTVYVTPKKLKPKRLFHDQEEILKDIECDNAPKKDKLYSNYLIEFNSLNSFVTPVKDDIPKFLLETSDDDVPFEDDLSFDEVCTFKYSEIINSPVKKYNNYIRIENSMTAYFDRMENY
jgi:hypothetical protein